MSDRQGQSSGGRDSAEAIRNRICRVSYTLNNAQPVTSTLIGEQPLFYMDFDETLEDDAYEISENYGPFENELQTLEREMKALEKFSGVAADNGERHFQLLLENSLDIAAEKTDQKEDHSFLVSRIRKVIGESRLAGAFLELADAHGVEIRCTSHIEYAFYDRSGGAICINPNNEFESLVLLTIRELRTHWQHRQGVLINPLMFHPDNAILINRAQMADLAVTMIRSAWELQLSGHKEIWERIEHSTMADLGHAFAREAYLDFRTINNGVACAAVFENWFLSERCLAQDIALIQKMLADHQGYVFDAESLSKGVTPELIAGLGSLPFGKNYLATHAGIIMSDPVFTDIRDRSSANFPWFIKFERSFRETERTLQNHPDQPYRQDALSGGLQQRQDDFKNGQGTAQIIKLEPEHYAARIDQSSGEGSDKILPVRKGYQQQDMQTGKDNVVYLGRWSAE